MCDVSKLFGDMSVDAFQKFCESFGTRNSVSREQEETVGGDKGEFAIAEDATRVELGPMWRRGGEITPELHLLTTSLTMSDYNNDDNHILPKSSQTQGKQQPETTIDINSLSTLDIPSSDLGLDAIITPSEPKNPEQWAELDSQS